MTPKRKKMTASTPSLLLTLVKEQFWMLIREFKSRIAGNTNKLDDQGLNAEKTTTELCPPNPNEFEMAAKHENFTMSKYGVLA